jgi:hypothetical protein
MESAAMATREGSRKGQRLWAGRGRLLVSGLAVACVAVLASWIWGARRLDGLPDIGEPFDVEAASRTVVIADADNAYVLYAEALGKRFRVPATISRLDFGTATWSRVGDDVRDTVKKNSEALELWRRGSERPAAIYHQPDNTAVDTALPLAQELAMLTRLAGLEGARHEQEGAMEEAWTWYRAMLRASRHLGMYGVIVERLIGARLHEMAVERTLHWASDPRVDAKMLRKALGGAIAADALTSPLSETLKREYLMYVRDLDEMRVIVDEVPMPGGRFGWLEQMARATGAKRQIQRWRLHATNDVERSRRAIRLLFANWLAQVDKPASKRAPVAIAKPMLIYAADPTAPAAARAVAPDVLDRAIDHTALAREMFRPTDGSDASGTPISRPPWEGDGLLAKETRNRAALIVNLAAELYRRDHGQPPTTAAALLGHYLKELPEGTHNDDQVPTALK